MSATATKSKQSQVWTPQKWSKEFLSAIPWNDQQINVFEEVEAGNQNLLISAAAGSGKSSTLKAIIGLLPNDAKINVMMYNVSVKEAFENDTRIPKRVKVSTAHGCGYGLLISYFRGESPKVEGDKALKLANWGLKRFREACADYSYRLNRKEPTQAAYPISPPMLPEEPEKKELVLERWRDELKKLIDFARLNLTEPTVESMEFTVSYFGIRFPLGKKGLAWGIKLAIDLLEDDFRQAIHDRIIDYPDMVWLPYRLKLYPRKPKAEKAVLLVDECVTGDTMVTLADGSTKRIDEIVESKLPLEVLSFNEKTQKIEVKKILGWHKVPRRNRQLVNIAGLTATYDHPVYTKEEGYIYAGKINRNHSLLEIDVKKLQSFGQIEPNRAIDHHRLASWRRIDQCQYLERETWKCQGKVLPRGSSTGLLDLEIQPANTLDERKWFTFSQAYGIWGSNTTFHNSNPSSIHGNFSLNLPHWEKETNYCSAFVRANASCSSSLVYGRWQLQHKLPNINLRFFVQRNSVSGRLFDDNGVRFQTQTNWEGGDSRFFQRRQKPVFSNHRTIHSSFFDLQDSTRQHSAREESQAICCEYNQSLRLLRKNASDLPVPQHPSLLKVVLQQRMSGSVPNNSQSSQALFLSDLRQNLQKSDKSSNRRKEEAYVWQRVWTDSSWGEQKSECSKTSLPCMRNTIPLQEYVNEKSWGVPTNLQQQMRREVGQSDQNDERDWVYCIDVEDNHNFFADGILTHNCQDANRAFISLYKKFSIVGYRCIFVGDLHQGISGYMAALPTAMQTIEKLFDCKVMPLAETQRLPKTHAALASLIDTQIRAREDAKLGSTGLLHPDAVRLHAKAGDLVLCRFVAPLIKLFLEAKFFEGKEGVVRARNIATEMSVFAKSIAKHTSWHEFKNKLASQKEFLVNKFTEAKQQQLADAIDDKYACLEYCYEFLGKRAGSFDEFLGAIEEAFPEEAEDRTRHIIFSSIHSAKGDEAERVIIVGSNILPYSRTDMLKWQLQQEVYLTHVALTRSKDVMLFSPLARTPEDVEFLMQQPLAGLQLEGLEKQED